MNNTNIDNFTKEIISESKLQLTNPDFNKVLMGKIKAEGRKRNIYSKIRLYSILFISIDATIIILLNLTGISISDISSFSRAFANFYANTELLIFIYFSVLLAIIFVFSIVSSTGYKFIDTRKT